MTRHDKAAGELSEIAADELPPVTHETSAVLQVEKHDYTNLRPNDKTSAQGMDGFDPIYTDIVDYIIRCTHRIWDEKNVGLIYTHYTHNAVIFTPLGSSYSREEVVRGTLQRIAEFPERRGLGHQVIWNGNDAAGFYTSHLVTSVGRWSTPGPYGPPNGKMFYLRTFADCMVYRNRIFREWIVRDNIAQYLQFGIDPEIVATKMAAEQIARGVTAPLLGDPARLLGQEHPAERIDTSIANTEQEAELLQKLNRIWNSRMFGELRDLYVPHVAWHGPRMSDVHGIAAVTHQYFALLAMMPDATWTPHHICTVEHANEGGTKIAVRWTLEGNHGGWGVLGAPTQKPLWALAVSHYHIVAGRIVEEFTLWDELALRVQLKLPPPG